MNDFQPGYGLSSPGNVRTKELFDAELVKLN